MLFHYLLTVYYLSEGKILQTWGSGSNWLADLRVVLVYQTPLSFILLYLEIMDKYDVIPIKFNGNNFMAWSFHLKNFVEGQGLFGYLDGSIIKPTTASTTAQIQELIQNTVTSAYASVGFNGGQYQTHSPIAFPAFHSLASLSSLSPHPHGF